MRLAINPNIPTVPPETVVVGSASLQLTVLPFALMRGLITALVGVLATAAMTAQEFEVASVRASPNDDAHEGISIQPNGGVRLTAFPVRTLMTIAFRSAGLQRFDQLLGGPSWIATDRFDIVAKAPDRGGPDALPVMLQTLLRDRFRLQTHTETRDMPAYALIVSRRDRQLGPEVHESTIDCAADATNADDRNRWCGIRATGGVIIGHAVSAAQLAGNLSGYPAVDRHVTDRTGLSGRYDFRLEYSPDFLQRAGDAGANPGPSIFTALTEQLGLSLQPETARLPVLVIDHIERPTEN
jgi:uncharacterized protein (TIGR03435 family)